MDGRAGGRRDITSIIFAFLNRFAKAPKRILKENVVRALTQFTSFWVAVISTPVLNTIMNLSLP